MSLWCFAMMREWQRLGSRCYVLIFIQLSVWLCSATWMKLWCNLDKVCIFYRAKVILESHQSSTGTFSKMALCSVSLMWTGTNNVISNVIKFCATQVSSEIVLIELYKEKMPFKLPVNYSFQPLLSVCKRVAITSRVYPNFIQNKCLIVIQVLDTPLSFWQNILPN